MIIIGEKINGAIKSVAAAIETRDEAFIHDLAIRQADGSASYIDVCAGVDPSLETAALAWLIDVVQSAVDVPVCIDSPSVQTIAEVIGCAKRPGMINSVSEESGKADFLFPLIADSKWSVICLTCDDGDLPTDTDTKVKIAGALVAKADKYGIARDRLYIDPLVNSIGTVGAALTGFASSVREIKSRYPEVHVTSGLSNISFGMPLRKLINQTFLVLAMGAGMDSAILDPTSRELRSSIYAAEMLLEHDEYCAEFLDAYREELIG